MKEIINVSIAGLSFRLDSEAFALLDKYFNKLRSYYRGISDGVEIIGDIETRIAEIILSKQETTDVVTLPLIESVISQMGSPEDISDGESLQMTESNIREEKIPRRLYRNPSGAKIAGVFSGLSAYTNIDVSILRVCFFLPFMIFFALLAFHMGYIVTPYLYLFPIFYLIAWIIIPKAKTPRQRLEMMGQRITTSTIEKTFRESFRDIDNNLNRKSSKKSEKNATIFTDIVSVIGRIVLFVLKFFIAIVFVLIIIASIISIVALILVMMYITYTPVVLVNILVTLAVLVFLIPVALALYYMSMLIFKFKNCRYVALSMVSVWIIALISSIILSVSNATKIEVTDINLDWFNLTIASPNKNVKIGKYPGIYDDYMFLLDSPKNNSTLSLSGDTLYIKDLYPPTRGDNKQFPIKVIRGANRMPKPYIDVKLNYDDILEDIFWGNIKDIRLNYIQKGDTLFIDTVTPFDRDDDIKVEFNLFVPDSTKVQIDKNIKAKPYKL